MGNQEKRNAEDTEKEAADNKPQYTEEERKRLTKENENRAQELLKEYKLDEPQKDSLRNMVKKEVKQRKMVQYGKNDLPAGPDIYETNKVILVEGRADVLNLMRMGIDNAIAVQGTNVPGNIIHLCNTSEVTALLDGDRGGDGILKELLLKTKIEYVARAPRGKEIEHLNSDEINQILKDNKKPVTEAEFIDEGISLVSFLKRNGRYNVYKS